MTISLIVTIAVIVAAVAILIIALAKQYRKVGPNEVLIVSGHHAWMLPLQSVPLKKAGVVVGTKEVPLVFGTDPIPESFAVIPGVKMHLSNRRCVPSGFVEPTCDCGGIGAQPAEISGNARDMRKLPNHEGCPGRLAERRDGEAVIEYQPFPSQPIQGGRLHELHSVAGQGIPSLLVGGYEQDVAWHDKVL